MSESITVGGALRAGQSLLFYAEVDTPMLDATVLLAEALGVSKERLLASLPEPLELEPYRRYRDLLERRCSGLPVSYIRGRKEFFSLEFVVDRRVMVPRPDTELLVEEALRTASLDPRVRKVHDTCSGSGCVAVALKHTLPLLEVSASELSAEALQVLRLNVRVLLPGQALRSYRSELLARVPGRFDMITANPPYLRDREVEDMRKVGWPEPELALRGGPEGTAVLQRLIRSAPRKLRAGGYLLLEAAPAQMPALRTALAEAGFGDIRVAQDLGGRDRVIRGRRA
jgi:release factor glutamine methyltransferase